MNASYIKLIDVKRELAHKDYMQNGVFVHERRYKLNPHSDFVGQIIRGIDLQKEAFTNRGNPYLASSQ